MKKIIWIVVFVVLAAAFVNDVSRYAKARYDLNNIAVETVGLVSTARSQSRDQNARDAARYASSRGATVYAFDQDDLRVYVWIQMPVEGTWILAPGLSLIAGESYQQPYQVYIEESASFR